ncbi:hypothetical protein ABK040_006117 [Willaertia magna]
MRLIFTLFLIAFLLLASSLSLQQQQQQQRDVNNAVLSSEDKIQTTLKGVVIIPKVNFSPFAAINDAAIKITLLRQDNPNEEELYFVRSDGTFTIEQLTPGSHLLQIYSSYFEFPQIRIDVAKSGKMRAISFIPSNHPSLLSPEEKQQPQQGFDGFGYVKQFISVEPYLKIKPLNAAHYFEQVVPFDFLSLLKNPMVLMVGFGLLVSFVFPKMIDPQALKEAQKSMNQGESEIKGLFSGLTGQEEGSNKKPIVINPSEVKKKKK